MSSLRNPLSIALSLSPIALLQDKIMWNGSAGSKFVLEVHCDRFSHYAAYLRPLIGATGFLWQQTRTDAVR